MNDRQGTAPRRRLDEAARRPRARDRPGDVDAAPLLAQLVAKGRVRWTADGVKLTGKGEPR
jgi:hypothetical protein